jgi:uncharacterized membrane protein
MSSPIYSPIKYSPTVDRSCSLIGRVRAVLACRPCCAASKMLQRLLTDSGATDVACNASLELTHGLEVHEGGEGSNTIWVGVVASVVSNVIIGVSMNVQKLAHNRNQDGAGDPIRHFTMLPLWWAGILMNIFGELGNMLAYGYAPVSLVAPVGSVGVFVNEVIAVLFLKEPFRKRDGLGLFGIVAGVLLIIAGVPKSEGMLDTHTLLSDTYFNAPRVWAYVALLVVGIGVFVCVLEPRCNLPPLEPWRRRVQALTDFATALGQTRANTFWSGYC